VLDCGVQVTTVSAPSPQSASAISRARHALGTSAPTGEFTLPNIFVLTARDGQITTVVHSAGQGLALWATALKRTAANGGADCIEAAHGPGAVLVRDTKDRDGETLAFSADAWSASRRSGRPAHRKAQA
jgi:hypothetical protein